MLVIHPDECIDCGVCEPECPADAIMPDTEPGFEKWLSVNAEYAKVWPDITTKKAPRADAKEWEGLSNKFEEQFSSIPGRGDYAKRLNCILRTGGFAASISTTRCPITRRSRSIVMAVFVPAISCARCSRPRCGRAWMPVWSRAKGLPSMPA
jgi:ferredoxin